MPARPEDIGLDNKSLAERDRIDLNHEQAGDDTGRIKRFLVEGASGYNAQSDEKKSKRRYQSLLEMILTQDPEYAALYNRVADKLDRAQRAVDKALSEIDDRLEVSAQKLQDMRDHAGELEDGTKVFRSSVDGGVYTEDGRRLSDEEAQNVDIPAHASSWEDYRDEKKARDDDLRRREEIERYRQEVLNPAQERMDDPNHPLSKDELRELDTRLERELTEFARDSYDGDVAAEMPAPSTISAAHELVEETNLNTPDVGIAFSLASTGMPDLEHIPDIGPDIVPATRAPA